MLELRRRSSIEARLLVKSLHSGAGTRLKPPIGTAPPRYAGFRHNIYGDNAEEKLFRSQGSLERTKEVVEAGYGRSLDASERPKTRINIRRERKLNRSTELGPSPLPVLTEKDFSTKQYDDWPAGVKKKAWMRPRHIKRWQRDLVVRMEYNQEKRRLAEIVRLKNYREIEERIQRRKQGLPELPVVHETMFGRVSRRERRRRKLANQERSSELVWTSRPRSINTLYRPEEEQEQEQEQEQGGWYWHSYEQQSSDAKLGTGVKTERKTRAMRVIHGSLDATETAEDSSEAKAEKRLHKFQRYVDKLPLFEALPTTTSQDTKSLLPSDQNQESGSEAASQSEAQAEFKIPPMVPGRGALLVAGLSDILKDGKWDTEKLARLEKFKDAKLLPYQICQVLKQLKDWQITLEFFTWCKSIPGFKHDTLNYSTVIMNLGKNGHYVEARRLFDEMLENQVPFDKFTVNNMIKCYGRANRIDDALAFHQHLSETGAYEPDNCTYALLTDLLGKAGRVAEMRQLFLDLKAADFKPDIFLFNSMIYNFGKWGDMSTVSEAAEQMTRSGVEYSTVTYATLIHLYAKVLDFKSAERTYSQYLQSHLEPDIYVFNSMIQVLGLAGRCREAEWAMEDIERAGLRPDAFSFCTIVSAWGRQGCATEAKAWFDKARRRGVNPTAEMCNALMDAFFKAGKLESVENLLKSMPGWGCRATLETYTYLLNLYTESREEFVKPLRDLMRKTGHPADKFLDNVFEGSVQTMELRDFAQEFFEKARLEEKPGWAYKFANALINYLQAFGYVNEAHRVFEAATATRLFPRDLLEDEAGQWNIWLVGMDEGTALVGLGQAVELCRQLVLVHQEAPVKVAVFSGTGRHRNTKTSLAVNAMLEGMRAPFEADPTYPRFDADGLNFLDWIKGTRRETLVEKVYKRVFSQLPASQFS